MAPNNHHLNIIFIIIASIALWRTTATIALSRSATTLEEFTESTELVSTLVWQASSEIDGSSTEQTPQDVAIGNLSIPICPHHHVCLKRSCHATDDMNKGCHCDEECTFFGDCCPIILSNTDPDCDRNKNTDLPSLYDYDRSKFTCEKLGSVKDPRYYYLVSRCPSDMDNEQLRVKCESDSSSSSGFSVESVPLSLENIVSFRNVYCAICNGQDPQGLASWSVSIECSEDIANDLKHNTRTVEDVIRNRLCAVDVEPPSSGKAVRACFVETDNLAYYVDTCPISSDSALQWACKNITANFVMGVHECFGFKNPACYACNFEHFPDRDTICVVECSQGRGQAGIAERAQPLSVLFDFSSESGVKILQDGKVVSETTVVCSPGEFYDPYVGSCTRLSCPLGYEMIGDDCVGEVSANDFTCRLLTSGSNRIVTASVITNDPGMCASFGSKQQICDVDKLGLEMNVQLLLACEESELGGHYETVFIWEMDEETQAGDTNNNINSMRSMIFDNITNDEVCNISSVSIVSRCKPNSLGNEDVCIHLNYDNSTSSAERGNKDADTATPHDVFKVLETLYSLIPNKNDIEKNISMFTCNLTTAELVCPSAIFNRSLFIHLGDDGMLQYEPSGDVIHPDEYVSLGDGTIRACRFLSQNGTVNETTRYTFFQYSSTQSTLSLAGTVLSLASLFTTLVCYTTFPSLRRLVSNQLIMTLCGSLFVAQCLLLFGGFASSVSQSLCTAIAAISHFFWLTVFSLSSSIAFDLRRTFGTSTAIRVFSTSRKSLALYISVATGIPLGIVGISLTLSFYMGDNIDLRYGNEFSCWVGGGRANLLVFGVPVLVLVMFNVSCFLDTVRGISKSKKDAMALHEGTENLRCHHELLKIAIKISSLMCFTWLCGFVAAFTKQQAVWYIFIIVNSLQGVYIFLAFGATRRVYKLWRDLLLGKRGVGSRSRDSTLPLKDRSTSSSVLKTSI